MGYVNVIKQGEVVCDIEDARIPAPTSEDVGKVLALKEDGSFEFVENGSGPVPPTPPTPSLTCEKGDYIKLGGKTYYVMSANEDLTDVLLLDRNVDERVHYWSTLTGNYMITYDGGNQGIAYVGSDYEDVCYNYYYYLDSDIKDAIIAQSLIQELWTNNVSEEEEGTILLGGTEVSYRIKKIDQVNIGTHNVYPLTLRDFINCFGNNNRVLWSDYMNVLAIGGPMDGYDDSIARLASDYGLSYTGVQQYIPPLYTFHINLTQVSWTK